MGELINGRTPEAIKIGLRNMLEACGEMCGEDTRCLHDICPYDGDSWCNESILMGALAYIERLEAKQPKWISVKERLPDAFVSVLVQMPGERPHPTVREGFISHDGIWCAGYFKRDPDEVTHWMPMPEPPKEDAHG